LNFWKILLSETPDTTALNGILSSFFRVRRKLIVVIEKLNRMNTENLDFYIKYGVLMKYILNDSNSSTSAYNKIMSIADCMDQSWTKHTGFSLLRTDVKVSMILISIETQDFMVVLDINSEVENLLKCSRNEIVGASIETIMPPMIAQAHQHYIQKFFVTMTSTCIGINIFRFIKCKDNLYASCCTSKSLVPKLDQGFQGVMFSYLDPRLTTYTNSKRHNTLKIVKIYMNK
jgi:hypothetical protein